MTETSPVSFQTESFHPTEKRVGSVGTIHPHVEVNFIFVFKLKKNKKNFEAKVIDEKGKTVEPGIPGELCVRGYGVMLGYWENKEKTREAIDQVNRKISVEFSS
jgi:fatty-acyl-CoA synthase